MVLKNYFTAEGGQVKIEQYVRLLKVLKFKLKGLNTEFPLQPRTKMQVIFH